MEVLINELNQINEFFDDNNYFDEYTENINGIIKKIIDSIERVELNKNDNNIYLISRIISRYIGFEDINFDDNNLVTLLDFIDWHYPTIIQHAEDWTSFEEQAGIDFVKMLKFSNKMNKKLTGLNHVNTLYGILIAILHCEDSDTEKFVLDNNIKMPKKMFESDGYYDSNMYDIIDLFKEKNYDIIY